MRLRNVKKPFEKQLSLPCRLDMIFKLCTVVLFIILPATSYPWAKNCNGSCQANLPYVELSSKCEFSCFENAKENIIVKNDRLCYREKLLSFPAYIESISTSAVNQSSMTVVVSWRWPSDMIIPQRQRGYEVSWILTYAISALGEVPSKCYTVTLPDHSAKQNVFNITCTRTQSDGPPSHGIKITFLTYVKVNSQSYASDVTPSRLQEITISQTDEIVGSFLPVWNTDLKINVSRRTLQVSFSPSPTLNATLYEVRVFDAEESECIPSEQHVDIMTVPPSLERTTVTFNITGYEECKQYCVSVHPVLDSSDSNCFGGCVTEMHDMLPFYVPHHMLQCKEWDANIIRKANPIKGEIEVSFNVQEKYKSCFSNFQVYLFKLSTDVCGEGLVVKREDFTWENSPSEMIFPNLAPGNYCLQFFPRHKACGQNRNVNICIGRYSGVIELKEHKETKVEKIIVDHTEAPNNVLLICILSLLGVVSVMVAVGIIFRRARPHAFPEIKIRKMQILASSVSGINSPSEAEDRGRFIKAVITHTHEKGTRDKSRALSAFLQDYMNFKTIRAEDPKESAQRPVDEESWITETLTYCCPRSTSQPCSKNPCPKADKRIIIVKSKRAVRLLRRREMRMAELIESSGDAGQSETIYENDGEDVEELSNKYEALDELFCRSINFIMNSLVEDRDDCHIFIVQFESWNETESFDRWFPGNRYYLPNDLGELCLALKSFDGPSDLLERSREIERMKLRWEDMPSYKQLLQVCHTNSIIRL